MHYVQNIELQLYLLEDGASPLADSLVHRSSLDSA
jgi:hypothetical protein